MPEIELLSPHLADLIAAGEVVERPASVVKELIENAFDAGARTVTAELRNGGSTYLRVTDDGCGMAPEDAGVAFLRHATSKLRDEHGLEAIGTFGFRGEALAAISAVSRITLDTRRTGADAGTHMTLEAGEIGTMYESGCPEGTTLVVEDLFWNTPARQKFLKSDRTEGSACVAAAFRCALGRPDVSVRCIKDGTEQFFSPGDGRMTSCVYNLLGRDAVRGMLPCTGEQDGVSVRGFVSSPSAVQGSRARQYFFCNGRPIHSPLLQAALEQAYRNSLLKGRFPACVLYLTLRHAAVDVNVHPAKLQVRFTQEKQVFDTVYYAVLSALEGERAAAAPPEPAVPEPAVPAPAARVIRPAAPPAGETPAAPRPYVQNPKPAAMKLRQPEEPVYEMPAPEAAPPVSPLAEAAPAEPPARLIGETMDTYILVEKGDTLLLIDKHAAHERIGFDRLKKQAHEPMAQTLLTPVPYTPAAGDAEVLRAHLPELTALGFALEPLGETSFMLRAIPESIGIGDAAAAVDAFCEALRRGTSADVRDEVLKTVACKAAIKAGWKTEPEELLRLAEAVLSGEIAYCPHGRPIAVAFTRKELDKKFRRIL